MQDAYRGNWHGESQVSAEMFDSLRELNHRFLDLVGAPAVGWNSSRAGLSAELSGQVTPLSPGQKKAVADCPYALFDLRFCDEHHWQARLQNAGQWCVLDAATPDEATLEFTRLALFFAWHVAATARLPARLLLGMNEGTATAFRRITIDRVPPLAATEAINLTARWSNRSTYWNALTTAACRPNSAALRRVQLSGLQLTAALQLP